VLVDRGRLTGREISLDRLVKLLHSIVAEADGTD
jgi:hypothetical protein